MQGPTEPHCPPVLVLVHSHVVRPGLRKPGLEDTPLTRSLTLRSASFSELHSYETELAGRSRHRTLLPEEGERRLGPIRVCANARHLHHVRCICFASPRPASFLPAIAALPHDWNLFPHSARCDVMSSEVWHLLLASRCHRLILRVGDYHTSLFLTAAPSAGEGVLQTQQLYAPEHSELLRKTSKLKGDG